MRYVNGRSKRYGFVCFSTHERAKRQSLMPKLASTSLHPSHCMWFFHNTRRIGLPILPLYRSRVHLCHIFYTSFVGRAAIAEEQQLQLWMLPKMTFWMSVTLDVDISLHLPTAI